MHTSTRGRARDLVLGLATLLLLQGLAHAGLPSEGNAATLQAPQLLARSGLAPVPEFQPALQDEAALRQALQQALWPPDTLRLANDYLRRFGDQPGAMDAQRLRQRAQPLAALLQRSDVHLFRAAFEGHDVDAEAAADLQLAAMGDSAAALRQAARAGNSPQPRRRVGWLQYAAALGSGPAAYALALHYRQADQPLLAAQFETRAAALGHVPPPGLDHARK